MTENDNNRSNDQDVWTEFETERGDCGTKSDEGVIIWGAYCPQSECGELNKFQGNPSVFANRPYKCLECGWVSLMDESVKEIQSDLTTLAES